MRVRILNRSLPSQRVQESDDEPEAKQALEELKTRRYLPLFTKKAVSFNTCGTELDQESENRTIQGDLQY